MFKKLLSNLAFNPSLIGKVGFYAKRLHQEASIRRMGAGILGLSLLLQLFIAAFPSQPTLARSGNDVIPGGVSNQGQIVNHCNKNNYNIKNILKYFGIDCQAIYYGKTQTISSRDNGNQLYSMGRLPYGKSGEVAVSIPNAGKFYMRPLSSWDSAGASHYKAVVGHRSNGTPFMILFSCGNLVIVGPPAPPPPPPPPPTKLITCANLLMSVDNKAEVPIDTSISFQGQATGKHTTRGERVNMQYQYIDAASKRIIDQKQANGITFSKSLAQDSLPRIFKVTKPGKYIFKLQVTYSSNGASKTASGSGVTNCRKVVTVVTQPICEQSKDNDITACLILSKKAKNNSRDLSSANGTTARAGDVVTYTLLVKNTSNIGTAESFIFEENITDVMEYATVLDLHGGQKDDKNIVRWPGVDIKPGETVQQQLTVKVKSPVPQTPVASSNPGSFDCVMTNVYGDTVNIKLNCGIAKTTEQITGTLPNTGPGETLAVAFIITTVASYFFARSKLMAKELDLVRTEYATNSGGGSL